MRLIIITLFLLTTFTSYASIARVNIVPNDAALATMVIEGATLDSIRLTLAATLEGHAWLETTTSAVEAGSVAYSVDGETYTYYHATNFTIVDQSETVVAEEAALLAHENDVKDLQLLIPLLSDHSDVSLWRESVTEALQHIIGELNELKNSE